MSNLVKKENTFLTTGDRAQQQEEFLSSDIIVPKILLMQGLSEFVTERKATQGDIVKSLTGEKIGDPDHPVDFIPLKMTNQWVLMEKVGNAYEFRGYEDRTPLNENSEWEYEMNGAPWKRVKTINVFALLPKDIDSFYNELSAGLDKGEAPDLNKTLTPVVISFRQTSFKAGRQVANFYASLKSVQKVRPNTYPYEYVLTLGCYLDKNDLGSFYVYELVGGSKKANPRHVEEAKTWYETFNKSTNIRIDESDVKESAAPRDKSTPSDLY